LEERRAFNFDHPDAFDTELLVAHLRTLKEGRAVDKPVYSFTEHSRTKDTVRVNPGDAIILEGILVLALEQARRELDVKVFVDRALRKVIADKRSRNSDPRSVPWFAGDHRRSSCVVIEARTLPGGFVSRIVRLAVILFVVASSGPVRAEQKKLAVLEFEVAKGV